MKQNAERGQTTQQLRNRIADGAHIVCRIWGPGAYDSPEPIAAEYLPRNRYDSYPWKIQGLRYRSTELTLVKVVKTEPVPGTLVDPHTWLRRSYR